jgi:hypothetical protein
MPKSCDSKRPDGLCMPPKAFVKNLCSKGASQETALSMFQKSSPWTRLYINRDLDAWYAGKLHAVASNLRLDEEVIVLSHGASDGGFSVGSGGFDVLRWNGDCVSISPEEVSHKAPRDPRRAPIRWQILDATLRDKLLANDSIATAEKSRRKLCKDDLMWGTSSKPCTKAVESLSRAITEAIRRGRVEM